MKKRWTFAFYIFLLTCFILLDFACTDLSYRESVDKIQEYEIDRSTVNGIFDPFLENPQLHATVALAIAHIGDSVHLDVLYNIIRSEGNESKKTAIFALGQIDHKKSRTLLHQLLSESKYEQFAGDIVNALSVNGSAESLLLLKEFCEKTQDSLKTITLRAIAILANRKSNSERMSGFVSPFLRSESEDVRSAAAYYFSRNISRFHIRDLIIAHFTKDRIGNKYRYKALDQIAKKYKKLPIDSTLLDTLRNDLERQLADNNIPWYTKFYQISLMALFNDSLAVKKVACFLTDSIPHLRTKAIEVLGSWHTPSVRGILIGHYSNALWLEKGYIIKSLADIDRRFTYRLIQQNLDQGTLCFKELLLESLAKINSSSAVVLLHQFLQIPNKRLKLCAFKQLADVHRVKRQDALLMINSGDPALTTVAAEWLYKNPGVVSIEQIEKSYNELKEPDGIEAMLSLMRLAGLKQEQTSIPFYLKALNETKSYILFQQISRNLKDLNIALADSLAPRVSLFVPPEAKDLGKSISVIMKTNKGEIIMDLWPQIAPFTVANFVHLAENGFYEGLAFHRVVADFVIQGGDPRGDGWGGPGYYIPCEYNYRPYVSGSVGIATSGKDTGGSQFFICHTEQPHLNGRYSNFGQVKDGMDVVNRIQRGDKIIEIIINKGV